MVLDADLAALAYSGGGSLVLAVGSVSVLGVDRAELRSFLPSLLDFPPAFADLSHVALLVAFCTC